MTAPAAAAAAAAEGPAAPTARTAEPHWKHRTWQWQLFAATIGFSCTGLFIGYYFLFLYLADAQGKDMPQGEEVSRIGTVTSPFFLVVLFCCAGPIPPILSKFTNPRVYDEDPARDDIHPCTPCACFTAVTLLIFGIQIVVSTDQLAEYYRLENTQVVEGTSVADVGLHAPNSSFRFADGVVATSLLRSESYREGGLGKVKRYSFAPVFTSEGCYAKGRQLAHEQKERPILAPCQVAFMVAVAGTTDLSETDFTCKGNTGTEYPLCVSPGIIQGCTCAMGGCTDCQPLGACEEMMTEIGLRNVSVCSAPWYLPADFAPRLAQAELSTNARLETLKLWAYVAAGLIFFQYAWGAWITAWCPRLAPADDTCNGCGGCGLVLCIQCCSEGKPPVPPTPPIPLEPQL